jgi:hypothetical protein
MLHKVLEKLYDYQFIFGEQNLTALLLLTLFVSLSIIYYFSPRHRFQTGFGAHQSSNQMGTGIYFFGIKAAGA